VCVRETRKGSEKRSIALMNMYYCNWINFYSAHGKYFASAVVLQDMQSL